MKEALFILLVVAALLAISMIKYRRRITGAIHLYKLLRGQMTHTADNVSPGKEKHQVSATELVNCARCGRWVSRSEAVRMSGGLLLCSIDCAGPTSKTQPEI